MNSSFFQLMQSAHGCALYSDPLQICHWDKRKVVKKPFLESTIRALDFSCRDFRWICVLENAGKKSSDYGLAVGLPRRMNIMAASTTTDIVYALAIPFACGTAVQRLLAILESLEEVFDLSAKRKAWLSATISFVCGLVVSLGGKITILTAIAGALSIDSVFNPKTGPEVGWAHAIDVAATALIVSAGTEGFNSIIKFLGYAKNQTKATAADKTKTAKAGDASAFKAMAS